MELPTEKSKVLDYNPQFMMIFSKPKVGKSTWISGLEDNLVIDLEDGYRSLSVLKVQARSYNDLSEIRNLIIKKGVADGCTKDNGKKPYRFITIDNASRLEEMCMAEAARLYRETTPLGKNWGMLKDANGMPTKTPDPNADVRTIPQGAGYLYLRMAVMNAIKMFKGLSDTLILVAHVKEKQITKESTEMTQMEIDLMGKAGAIMCGEADAIGYMYRIKNQTIMSFKGGDDVIRQARPVHLRDKEFVVIESDDEGNITINTKEIFQ